MIVEFLAKISPYVEMTKMSTEFTLADFGDWGDFKLKQK
ncbi:hypothetical protein NU08_2042 [Flavobacterium anhuiense]|uniref:Uncharacterized protein n=1 Tax=Flavobacterium anhuiense TaxID=459526 RepID=A0A444VZ04_9FLAO|nr:hypothetical protein NU08_2042 [Flavobacterium anhuiense]